MAVLTNQERDEATREAINLRHVTRNATAVLTTTQWRTLLNAADDFLQANATAYNQSIPQPVRGIATADDKAVAIAISALKRAARPGG